MLWQGAFVYRSQLVWVFQSKYFSMKSLGFFLCLTSKYETWYCLLDVWSLLPFGTLRIITIAVIYGKVDQSALVMLPVHSPKPVGSHWGPCISFFLTFQTSLPHFFDNIPIQFCQIDSAASDLSYDSRHSKITKQSAMDIIIPQGPSQHNLIQLYP